MTSAIQACPGVRPSTKATSRGVTPLTLAGYHFKSAQTEQEFEQIHRLNYETFVQEIRQHSDNGRGQLVDKFHEKNHYIIALRDDGHLAGMVTAHDQAPFSVADNLDDPAGLDRIDGRLLEVRLLAIRPGERHSVVFKGLIWQLYEYAQANGYTHIVISGLLDMERLYLRIGFTPLGPTVRRGRVSFTPMVLLLSDLHESANRWRGRIEQSRGSRKLADKQSRDQTPKADAHTSRLSLLPGPPELSDDVRQAYLKPLISHRSAAFIRQYQATRRILQHMVGGHRAALFSGSGTLANEVVAATIAADRQLRRGLILVNGEFGRRLTHQARRFGLAFDVLEFDWGMAWDLTRIRRCLKSSASINWIWGVHQESSTGVLNDLAGLLRLTSASGTRVCVDCVSSLGAVSIEIAGVHLATGASGKSLGAIAGVAIVFAAPDALDSVDFNRVPTYLDIGQALRTKGPRFTCASPVFEALHTALQRYRTRKSRDNAYRHYADLGTFVRRQLLAIGITPLAEAGVASPVITTFTPPGGLTSHELVELCRSWGFEIYGHSAYLQQRNWIQIATMGSIDIAACRPLFMHLRAWLDAASS